MKAAELRFGSARHLRLNGPFLHPASCLSVQTRLSVNVCFLVVLFLFVFLLAEAADAVLSVGASRYPQAALVALHGLVLRGQVDAFTGLTVHTVLVPALGKVTRTGRELGLDGCVGGDPVGQGIFAVLDDTIIMSAMWAASSSMSFHTPC